MMALEKEKHDIALLTIEKGKADSFDYNRGVYAGVATAINVIQKLISEKGRADGDL